MHVWIVDEREVREEWKKGSHEPAITGAVFHQLSYQASLEHKYRIYPNKRRGAFSSFRASNAVLTRGRLYLKIGRDKEIFSFILTVYFLAVRKFYSN